MTNAILFLFSLFSLCFELLHIRVLGYVTTPVLSYCAISFAMLGFAGGAAVVSLAPSLARGDVRRALLPLGLLFGLSVYASGWALTLVARFTDPATHPAFNAGIVLALFPSVVPYALAGVMLSILFAASPARSARTYFLNLLGSSIGCLVPLAALRWAGAERLLAAVGSGGILAALLAAGILPRRARAAAFAAAAAAAVLLALVSGRLFTFRPDPTDQHASTVRDRLALGLPAPVREAAGWDPVARIEVWRVPGGTVAVPDRLDYRIVTVDAGASTTMLKPPAAPSWGRELFEESLYGAGYHVTRPHPRVLVIGSGGGMDIQAALHWKAARVTGAEINRTTVDLVTGPYRGFAGLLRDPDRVRIVHADGRNFALNTKETFDLIQMSGVDTLTPSTPGAMVLLEDYLYTVEAFRDFFAVLAPGGTLTILRFDLEGITLGRIAMKALASLGVADPRRHFVVLTQERLAGVVIKKEPFTPAELGKVEALAARTTINRVVIPHYNFYGARLGAPFAVAYSPGRPETAAALDAAAARGIPTDDRPYYVAHEVLQLLKAGKTLNSIELIKKTWAIVLAASFLLLFLPLLSPAARRGAGGASLLLLAYFLCIAVGFMFIEIGLIQKTIVFIGYPGGSAAIVLAALLVGLGAGSWASGRLRAAPARLAVAAAPAVVAAAALYVFSGPALLGLLAHLPGPLRWACCSALVAAVGLPMGFLYPSGLRIAGERHAPILPWAIAVNGFGGAAASVVALPLSVAAGHRALVLAGGGLYLLAAVCMLVHRKVDSRQSTVNSQQSTVDSQQLTVSNIL